MKLFKTNIYHDNILMSLFSYIHVVFDKTGKNWEPMQKLIPSILVQSCHKLLLHILKEFTSFDILSIFCVPPRNLLY